MFAAESPVKPLVLVVDDEPVYIRALFAILERDCVICVATGGEDALRFCHDRRPDLLLLDMSMPDMDGLAVCRRLKAHAATQHIPIIFVTANESPLDEARAFEEGAVDFITKPFHERVVKARVNAHVTLKRQSDTLRSLAADLTRARDEALHAATAKSTFLATMSHEIRTPMNGIIGLTTLLLDGANTSEQREHLNLLVDAGKSLLTIINDILDLSKIEAGKIDLEAIALSPAVVVNSALSLVRTLAEEKGLGVDGTISADVPAWVTGDPTRLRQILLNLLSNALKFTERGRVAVSVRRTASDAGNDWLRFEVCDTGIGIATELQDRLFKNFSQVDRSNTRQFGGTGLGLAISRQLVQAMGGAIGVTSQAGAGSSFWFTVPLIAATDPSSQVVFARRREDVVRRRILVADDNRVNGIVARGLLEKDGHEVVVVADGLAAVVAVQEQPFDLVLMDMQMPTLSGIEATSRIRALGGVPARIPIVALTANVMADQIASCRAAGMNDHLAKPIDAVSLRLTVAKWTAPAADAQSGPRAVAVVDSDGRSLLTDLVPRLAIDEFIDLFGGDGAVVGAFLDEAVGSMEADLERLEFSLREREAQVLIEVAHHLRGTAGNLRVDRVVAICSRIELTSAEHLWDIAQPLIGDLRAAIATVRAQIGALANDGVT